MKQKPRLNFINFEQSFDHTIYNLPIPTEDNPRKLIYSCDEQHFMDVYPSHTRFEFEKVHTPKGYFWMMGECLFKGGGVDLIPDYFQFFKIGDVVCDRSIDEIQIYFRENEYGIMERKVESIDPHLLKVVRVEREFRRYYYTLIALNQYDAIYGTMRLHQSKIRLAPTPKEKPSLASKIKNLFK